MQRRDSRSLSVRAAEIAPAGVTSNSLGKALGKTLGSDLGASGVEIREKPDLTLLYQQKGPRPEEGGSRKRFRGLSSRVDPQAYEGCAGTTSEKFTYNMVNPDDWEFMPRAGDKPTVAGRDISTVNTVKSQRKAEGECQVNEKTDPITHFKYEGIVFKDPWKPNKRTGYSNLASVQTWTWQQALDEGKNRVPSGKISKNKVDCRGKIHYLSGGEEDMIPAAMNNYIKCDKRPTSAHVERNDKSWLAWCQRPNAPQRPIKKSCTKYTSEQVWDCLVHQPPQKIETCEASAQASVRSSASAVDTPPTATRQVLARVQSEPGLSSARASSARPSMRSIDDDMRAAWAAAGFDGQDFPSTSAPSQSGVPSTMQSENIPPIQMTGAFRDSIAESGCSSGAGSMPISEDKVVQRADSARHIRRKGAPPPREPPQKGVPGKRPARSLSLTPRGTRVPFNRTGFPYNPARSMSATFRFETNEAPQEGMRRPSDTPQAKAQTLDCKIDVTKMEPAGEPGPPARRRPRSASMTSLGSSKPAWR